MQLGAHMVERRNTEKAVIVDLLVVIQFPLTGGEQRGVAVYNSLGGSCGSGGEISRGILFWIPVP